MCIFHGKVAIRKYNIWFRGVVGYHTCLTRMGSPVRSRTEPIFNLCTSFSEKESDYRQEEVILNRDGTKQTLASVFENVKLKPEDLTVNSLDVYAGEISSKF